MNKKISTPIAIGIILILSVILGSFTVWQYSEIRKEESNVPEVQIPEKGEVENETAGLSAEALATEGWQIYRNEEYGFEIGYPEDLNPEVKTDIPADNIFSLYFGDGKNLKMSVYDTGMEGQIRLYMIEDTEEKILVGNIEGSQFHKVDMKGEVSYIPHTLVKNKGRLYLFTGEGETFNQMLSTFKFIK